jgi:hypothetical protein
MMALTTLSCAADQSTNLAFEGYRLCFQLGQEYQKIAIQGGTVDTYNALVDEWNAFVRTNYGEEAGLLMTKMEPSSASVNLQKPYALGKNTTNKGIVHSIDGSGKWGPSYTTNDVNALSDSARLAYRAQDSQPP